MPKRALAPGAALVVLCLGRSPAVGAPGLDVLVPRALDFAAQQLAISVAQAGGPTRFPRSTRADGGWQFEDATSWTSGFFPGCLWLMFQYTGDPAWSASAASWTAGMESQKYDTSTHDVGFKILCSFGNGARLTSNPAYPDVIRQGANSLATRFDPDVGCTRSWNDHTFPVIVDNMMNLELLFWGASHAGDPAWRDMAVRHALRTRQEHVRADGSTFHLVDYNPTTGAVLGRETVQGYSASSTWARGQAWGLYGFTLAYRETGDTRLLDTACQLADWFVDHLPADAVPYWDFNAPNIPNEPRDSSAAAIAASGLLELSGLASGAAQRTHYHDGAEAILRALCSPDYLAEGSSSRGLLLHGVGHRPANYEVDVSLIYGDYYFLEALLRWRALVTGTPPAVGPGARTGLQLEPASPNPFNPRTALGFVVPDPEHVVLQIYDARGAAVRTLADGVLRAGRHTLEWDGRGADGAALPSGVYYCRLGAGACSRTSKLTLVR